MAVTGSACQTNQAQSTCAPTLNPGFSGGVRINGKWGQGITAANTAAISYIAPSVCVAPTTAPTGPFINPSAPTGQTSLLNTAYAPSYTFGNSARTAPYNLYNMGNYDLDIALVRSFPLHITERTRFDFRAEMYNVTNHTHFLIASTAVGNAAFGQVTNDTGSKGRQVQFSCTHFVLGSLPRPRSRGWVVSEKRAAPSGRLSFALYAICGCAIWRRCSVALRVSRRWRVGREEIRGRGSRGARFRGDFDRLLHSFGSCLASQALLVVFAG